MSYIVKQFYEPYLVRIKNKDTLFNHINYEVPEGHNYVVQLLNSMKVPLTVHVLLFIDKRQSLNMEEVMKVIKKLIIYQLQGFAARIFMKDDKFYLEGYAFEILSFDVNK